MNAALLLAAPIRMRLGVALDALAPGDRKFCREQLRGVASISDRAELHAQLEQYLAGAGAATYETYRRWRAELPPEAKLVGSYVAEQGERLRRVFALEHAGGADEVPVVAWDVARAVHYATLGVGAGFLDEHEAWPTIAKAAQTASATYRSWAEYGAGLVYGRWFWAGYWDEGMTPTQKAVDALLAGAWRDAAWAFETPVVAAPRVVEEALTAIAVRMFVDCPGCFVPVLVRDLADEIVCGSCGLASAEAARDAWATGASTMKSDEDDEEDEDEDDEEEEDEEEEDEGDAEEEDEADDGDGLMTNLDDRIARVIYRRDVAIPDGERRPPPAWLKERAPRLRYVVGGPISIDGGFLTLLFGGAS